MKCEICEKKLKIISAQNLRNVEKRQCWRLFQVTMINWPESTDDPEKGTFTAPVWSGDEKMHA